MAFSHSTDTKILLDMLEKSDAIFIMEDYSLSIYISISIVMGS